MRKVFVEITVKLKVVLNMDEGIEVSEVVKEIDYAGAVSNTEGADIENVEVLNNISHEVTDSK